MHPPPLRGFCSCAHLPDFEDKDVSVDVDRGALVIQAERRETIPLAESTSPRKIAIGGSAA